MTAIAVALLVLGAALYGLLHLGGEAPKRDSDISSQSRNQTTYKPTPTEWAGLTVEPVTEQTFRAEHVTEGKIAVDEDRSTPVFSPYTGRVVKLLVKPGETVKQGQPLFVIEAADTVSAQNDFITAINGLNKAKSALDLAEESIDQLIKFVSLLQSGERGFTSRLIPAQQFDFGGDYDHLARVSEWSTAEDEEAGGDE